MYTAGPPLPPGWGDGSYGTNNDFGNSFQPLIINTNKLWLEITGVTNNYAYITAHHLMSGWFQLWSKTDLLKPGWKIEQQFGSDPASQVVLSPVSITNATGANPDMFFWAAQGFPLVRITKANDAFFNNPLTDGKFLIQLQDDVTLSTNLAVYYSIGGTASNGVDYSSISDSHTIFASFTFADIPVHPIATNMMVDKTVTLTLTPTNGYLADSNGSSATVLIISNPFLIVTNINGGGSIESMDYCEPANTLILSDISQFYYVGMNVAGGVTNVFSGRWSGVSVPSKEWNITTVKTNAHGFTNGYTYYCSGFDTSNSNSYIGEISADGTSYTNIWSVLPDETAQVGGLYVDRSGVFDGDLIAVTGDDSTQYGGRVWRIDNTNRIARQVANFNTPLYGVLTLGTNQAKWGPWAGKIITADRLGFAYAIDTNRIVTTNNLLALASWAFGIDTESMRLIPPNQDLYIPTFGSEIYKLPRSYFTNYIDDVLITDELGALYIVHWDSGTTNFVLTSITGNGNGFEQSAFAPLDLPARRQ